MLLNVERVDIVAPLLYGETGRKKVIFNCIWLLCRYLCLCLAVPLFLCNVVLDLSIHISVNHYQFVLKSKTLENYMQTRMLGDVREIQRSVR